MSGDLVRRKTETSNGQFKRRRFKIRQGKKEARKKFLNFAYK